MRCVKLSDSINSKDQKRIFHRIKKKSYKCSLLKRETYKMPRNNRARTQNY